MTRLHIACRICGSLSEHSRFICREMMYGTREEFEYFKCSDCGCLQIKEIPHDLERYYPSNYYSFSSKVRPNKRSAIRYILEKQRARTALFDRGHKLNKLLRPWVSLPHAIYDYPYRYIMKAAAINNFNTSFLDIGCGSHSPWLRGLKQLGFNNLLGIDPYIETDVNDEVHIIKAKTSDIEGNFDIISLHHSLEHMADQMDALSNVRRLLNPNGVCLIRVPLVDSFVWKKYGTDWIELDAPRHLYLHTQRSFGILARNAKLTVFDTLFDSTRFEFIGSEQYRRGISMMSDDSFFINPDKSTFVPEQIAEFEALAAKVNRDCEGGRACFFLRTE
jgi:SAM-dependent methyltransferase